jgi:hypothetical protein
MTMLWRIRTAATAAIFLGLLAADAAGPPLESTTIDGDISAELSGRWLVVEQNRLVTGLVQPFARLWEIRPGPQQLELVVHRTWLPERLATKLRAAGNASRPWTPDDDDLRLMAERWDALPPSDDDVQRIEHRLTRHATGEDGLEIVTEERFSDARALRERRSRYAVRERGTARLAGSFVAAAELEVPAPVSIDLKGEFQAYRLPVVSPRTRLRRCLDMLLGGNGAT